MHAVALVDYAICCAAADELISSKYDYHYSTSYRTCSLTWPSSPPVTTRGVSAAPVTVVMLSTPLTCPFKTPCGGHRSSAAAADGLCFHTRTVASAQPARTHWPC